MAYEETDDEDDEEEEESEEIEESEEDEEHEETISTRPPRGNASTSVRGSKKDAVYSTGK